MFCGAFLANGQLARQKKKKLMGKWVIYLAHYETSICQKKTW